MLRSAMTTSGERLVPKGLMARSDARGLAQLAWHTGALLLTAFLVFLAAGSGWLVPAMVGHGIVLVFLFAPLHESAHRTAFRSRRLNDAVAWVCGAALVLPPEYFRAFHFAHHRHTQDPARDPELMTPKPRTRRDYLRHVSGLPYWRERITTTLRHARGRVDEPFLAPRLRATLVHEARLLLGAYAVLGAASIAAGNALLLWYWVLPALLGQPFLRMYLLAEHTGCPFVPDMLKNSRTTLTTAIVRRLAWNMSYHAEHHALPALPFHALPAAHALLEREIAVQSPGYVAAHREIVARLGSSPR